MTKEYTYKLPLVSLALYALVIRHVEHISGWWVLGPLVLWLGLFVLARLVVAALRR